MGYPAVDSELFGIRNAILYWKFDLPGAKHPLLVHPDHVTLRWIVKRPHLTIWQMDMLTVLLHCDWEVKHIPGFKNNVSDGLSHHLDIRRQRCDSMAPEVNVAGEWIDDINVGIVDDERFGPVAHSFANPSLCLLPSTASSKERKLLVSAQWFYLEHNALLWLPGDLDKKLVERNARAEEKDKEEVVEITVRAKEQEEDGMAEKIGWLWIPKAMRRRILHDAQITPTGGHFSADRTYLQMSDRYFRKQMWTDM